MMSACESTERMVENAAHDGVVQVMAKTLDPTMVDQKMSGRPSGARPIDTRWVVLGVWWPYRIVGSSHTDAVHRQKNKSLLDAEMYATKMRPSNPTRV